MGLAATHFRVGKQSVAGAYRVVARCRIDAGAFAFVMGTGIVSIGASQQALPVLSNALLAVAGAAWVTLAVTVWLQARRAGRGAAAPF